MAFTKDEKELLLDVLDRAIYKSQDEIEEIEMYLNAVLKGKILYAPEMQNDVIDCARGHADAAHSELHKLIELKNKIFNEIK